MGLATVKGKILASDGQPFEEPPIVELRQVNPEPTNGTADVLLPSVSSYEADESTGYLELVLEADSDGTAYEFRILSPEYNTNWFLVVLFAGAVRSWADVLPTEVPAVRPDLDRSVARIAQQISSDPSISGLLRGSVGLTPRGIYLSTAIYRQGDLVSFQGASYTPILPTPISGVEPTADATRWQVIAARGLPGGTGGDNSNYSEAAWKLDTTNAPSKAAVARKLETVDDAIDNRLQLQGSTTQLVDGIVVFEDQAELLTLTNIGAGNSNRLVNATSVRQYAAPLSNPTFVDSVIVPTYPANENSQRVANTAWTRAYAEAYWNSVSRPNPIASRGIFIFNSTFNANTGASLVYLNSTSRTLLDSFVSDGIFELATVPNTTDTRIRVNPTVLTRFPGNNYQFFIRVSVSLTTSSFAVQNPTITAVQIARRATGEAGDTGIYNTFQAFTAAGIFANNSVHETTHNLLASQLTSGCSFLVQHGTQAAAAGLTFGGRVNIIISLIRVTP